MLNINSQEDNLQWPIKYKYECEHNYLVSVKLYLTTPYN